MFAEMFVVLQITFSNVKLLSKIISYLFGILEELGTPHLMKPQNHGPSDCGTTFSKFINTEQRP